MSRDMAKVYAKAADIMEARGLTWGRFEGPRGAVCPMRAVTLADTHEGETWRVFSDEVRREFGAHPTTLVDSERPWAESKRSIRTYRDKRFWVRLFRRYAKRYAQ
jgi:hypothetical protein